MFSFAASRECQMGPTLGMDFACMLGVRERGASRVQQPGYSFSLPLYPTRRTRGTALMTTTAIGILLIVLCVLQWATMAALHRHTVQMKALQAQLDRLLDARQGKSPRVVEGSPIRSEYDEPRILHASAEKRA